jgi:hypothetical protein
MPKILTNVEMLKRVTVWVDSPKWDQLADLVPNRSEFLRQQIEIKIIRDKRSKERRSGSGDK